jgi:type II secretory pathway pseudopilin PulG
MLDNLFALVIVIIVLVFLAVVARQALTTYRVKVESSKDQSYRMLAQEAVMAQIRAAEELAELRARLTEVERLLKEID